MTGRDCPACGRSFATEAAVSRHRPVARCYDPAMRGLVLGTRSGSLVWQFPQSGVSVLVLPVFRRRR